MEISIEALLAGVVVFCICAYSLYPMVELMMPTDEEKRLKKYVVIVRQAAPGEFGGFVNMQSVRSSDDWRVTWAESSGDAVSMVLGAGEVPVVWGAWDSLSWGRRAFLNVREFWRFVWG